MTETDDDRRRPRHLGLHAAGAMTAITATIN